MIHYDFKPSKLEANGNGSYTYRWDIQEVQVENHFGEAGDNGQTTKWTCNEVVVWGMVTNDKLKRQLLPICGIRIKKPKLSMIITLLSSVFLLKNQLPMITRNICKREKLSKK